MKRWVVENFDNSFNALEWKLNALERSGRKIKEIIRISNCEYQIIYTEEDTWSVDY